MAPNNIRPNNVRKSLSFILVLVSMLILFLAFSAWTRSLAIRPDGEQSSSSSSSSQELLDFDLEAFLSTFTAANPEYTEQCKAYLRSPAEFNKERESYINWKWQFSQYNQDWFMFVNFFYKMAISNEKGFYIESGANDPLRVSNTAMLDLCLGWSGICIEPTARYHAGLRQKRTCILETNCLSNKQETIKISNEVPGQEEGAVVECVRLDSILDKHGVKTVHLWSLDIEGFEDKALAGIDLTKYDVQSILMEQQDVTKGVCAQMTIDYRLSTLGYSKYRLVSDGFYVKENHGNAPRFPDVSLLDKYFHELEDKRCRELGASVSFFTDKQ